MEGYIPPYEDDLKQWFIKNKLSITIALYIIGCFLKIIAHAISPTSLAGPGLDLLVILITLLLSVFFILKSIYKQVKYSKHGWFILIHLLGLIAILLTPPI
jgi:VIT1/CCC1 family predicted Fe2+/Mn2+ transporter